MAAKKKASSTPHLKVFFDTSVLYTQVAYDFARKEIAQLIAANSSHPDLQIQWYVPKVVVDERRHQMQLKALELLPSINKLETLLGHNLNITKDILFERIDHAIQQQLKKLGILEWPLDTKTVDWDTLIQRAVNRYPPFESGEKEKGFRDSLIAESFLQIVRASPVTPSVCRLAIVADDQLLRDFVTESTSDTNNVRVLSNASELESLINTLVSTVTEEFVAELAEKANAIFFKKEDEDTLYYKEKIREKINEQHSDQLKATPESNLIRENGTWWISKPVFVKKERQRVYWTTTITVDYKLSRLEPKLPSAAPAPQTESAKSILDVFMSSKGLLGMGLNSQKVDVGAGKTDFQIHWSVNITSQRKLVKPAIDKIESVGTKWAGE